MSGVLHQPIEKGINNMTITENTKIILHKKIDVVDVSGEKVMADFASGKYYMLKGSANDIWDLIQSDTTVSELKSKLIDSFDVDEDTCLQSTIAFLEQLHENGFIHLQ